MGNWKFRNPDVLEEWEDEKSLDAFETPIISKEASFAFRMSCRKKSKSMYAEKKL